MRHYARLQASPANESPQESAIAELTALQSSLGALSAQAQSTPSIPPLPAQPEPQHSQRQATDYSGLFDDDAT